MVIAGTEGWIQNILCSVRQNLAQGALRYGQEPGEWFHRVPSGARQHDFCSKARSSKAMALQNAIFCRLDDLPHSCVLIQPGLAKSVLPLQGILGRLRGKTT